MLIPSCNIRYELYPFYNQVTVSVPTPQEQPRPNQKGTVEFGIISLILFYFILLFFYKELPVALQEMGEWKDVLGSKPSPNATNLLIQES